MNPKTRLLVTALFGWAGIHHFIDRKTGLGILYLCTFGLCGIGWIFDIVHAVRALPKSTSSSSMEIYAAGVPYCRDNIYRLAKENPRYSANVAELVASGDAGKRIFRYWFKNKPVELVPEPSNPHDKNAIAIVIAGQKVGYVPKDETSSVREFISSAGQYGIDAFISGGPYKVISSNGDSESFENNLRIYITITKL